MKRLFVIIITIIALSALVLPASASTNNSHATPYFNILDVVKDTSVTIQAYNFLPNDDLQVTMGNYGTFGIGGIVVTTSNSGSSGSFIATYTIPSSLAGLAKIAIRLQSPTTGYFAYNWFFNNTAPVPSETPSTTPPPSTGYSGFPTFSIDSVVKDVSVTIVTNNLPPNDTFNVTMGDFGSLGIGGVNVGTTDSGAGGVLTLTYNIPESLKGKSKIAIRMQSPTSGFFAYNWFFNNTATAAPTTSPQPTTTPVPPGYSGFPTFTITAVVKDQTVTISGTNFPANDTFTVLMGPYGTKGIGGVNVGSTDTGSGGSLTATYNIPSSLTGSGKIAIRLESPTSGFFAYNWFFNNTTP